MVRYSSGDSHYCVVRAPFRFLGFGFVSESGFQLHHKNAFFIVWTRFQKVKLATQHEEFAFPWELWSRVSWASRAVLVEFCAQHSSDVAFSTFRFLKSSWKHFLETTRKTKTATSGVNPELEVVRALRYEPALQLFLRNIYFDFKFGI